MPSFISTTVVSLKRQHSKLYCRQYRTPTPPYEIRADTTHFYGQLVTLYGARHTADTGVNTNTSNSSFGSAGAEFYPGYPGTGNLFLLVLLLVLLPVPAHSGSDTPQSGGT
eukprot:329626-Rhodomonas_salina.1